jgi:tetratricopeptide (TPR) repeat protein
MISKFTTDVTVVDLSTFSIEAALELLQNSLTDKSLLDDQESAIALVQGYNFSPLAIAQIAAYINREKINLSQFIYLLEGHESKIKGIGGEIEERYKDSNDFRENALILTIQQIQQQNQLAADYISFMACMDPDIIPQSLLPPAKPEKRAEIIGLLKDSNIIQETVQGYYTIHRSIRRIIRDRMKSAQQFRQQILKAADRLREVFLSNDHAKREIWREYLPHAMSLLAEVEFQEEQAKYTSFMRRVGRCLYSEKRYSEAATIFETIMAIRKSQDSDTSSSTLSSMADLAQTYEQQLRLDEVRELEIQMVELSKRVLRTEYPNTFESISQSSLFRLQGKYEEAELRHGQAPEAQKKGFEPEDIDNLQYYSRLGLTLNRWGKHEEAENLHRLAFGCLHKVFGTTHPYTLTGIFNISNTLIAQDKKEDAHTLLRAFIELRGKSLGPDHSDTEDASYCRGQWEDYYRMRLLRKRQYGKIRLNIPGKSQQIEDKAGTAPPNEQYSGTPAQRFIRDHPLLRASRSGQSVQEDHDLQEVD